MCLIAVRVHPNAAVPCVLLANRDEFHGRAARPLDWWSDAPDTLGGRDGVAGGAWLALRRDGRIAAVTNYREPDAEPGQRSRGELPCAWLHRAPDARTLEADWVAQGGGVYGGFNLLYGVLPGGGQPPFLRITSNRWTPPREVAPGCHAISNGHPDAGWPKMARGAELLQRAVRELEASDADPARWSAHLMDAFSDRWVPDPVSLPDTGVGHDLERFLSPVFIRGEAYGTRCTTAVVCESGGRVHVQERRYDSDGEPTGETAISLDRTD